MIPTDNAALIADTASPTFQSRNRETYDSNVLPGCRPSR